MGPCSQMICTIKLSASSTEKKICPAKQKYLCKLLGSRTSLFSSMLQILVATDKSLLLLGHIAPIFTNLILVSISRGMLTRKSSRTTVEIAVVVVRLQQYEGVAQKHPASVTNRSSGLCQILFKCKSIDPMHSHTLCHLSAIEWLLSATFGEGVSSIIVLKYISDEGGSMLLYLNEKLSLMSLWLSVLIGLSEDMLLQNYSFQS